MKCIWVEKNHQRTVCFIKDGENREEILRVSSILLWIKVWKWDSSEVICGEEIEAWRLPPKALIRKPQKDDMYSARLRSFFSELSSQYIQLIQSTLFSLCLVSQLQTVVVTPRLVACERRGTFYYLVTEKKGIHSPDRASCALALLENWSFWFNFYTSILINMAIKVSAALIKYSTWRHYRFNSSVGTVLIWHFFIYCFYGKMYSGFRTIYRVADSSGF